jgi:hypothetical protein
MGLTCAPSGEYAVTGNAALATAAFLGMGLLCGFEMLFLIWSTFRRRSGLYFWSLVIATIAEISVNIANILYYWVLRDSCPAIVAVLSIPGSLFFVVFEYFVLYSRLRLVQASNKKMRVLLGVIFTEALLIELPLAALYLASIIRPSSELDYLYFTIWQVEAVVYTLVDVILSLTYILQVRSMWSKNSGSATKSILRDIVYMTIVVIGFDVLNAALVFVDPVFPVMYGLEVHPAPNASTRNHQLTLRSPGLSLRVQVES